MIFLNVWAFGLFSLVAGITALYFLRRREERLTVSALWLWPRDQERPRSALTFLWMQPWLLLVQIALLAALIFALAAPTLTSEFLGSGALAVIIDGSASMQSSEGGGTRYDRAVAVGVEQIERRRPRELTIIQAQRAPRVLVPLTADRARALEVLKSSRPTLQGDAEPSLLLEVLRGQGGLTSFDEIVYLSDRAPALSGDGPMSWIAVGQPGKNLAITGFAARPAPAPMSGVTLWARIENFSSESVEGTLKFFAREKEILSELVRLQPNERRSVELVSREIPAGPFTARLEVTDDFAFDNVRYSVIPERPKLTALWLGERNFFLERALALGAELDLRSGDTDRTDTYDLVIANNTDLQGVGAGQFLLINSSLEPLLRLGEVRELQAFPALNKAHAVVETVRPEHFQSIVTRTVELDLEIQRTAQTLLTADGQPILSVYRRGAVSFVYLGIDLRTSPLVLTPSFPIFVQNAVRWLVPEASLPTEQFVSEEFYELGFTERTAVNLDPRESQINEFGTPSASRESSLERVRAQIPVWHYGAWLALGLFVLELFLYNRGLVRPSRDGRVRGRGDPR